MTSDDVGNTNAVFTSDVLDRDWHPEGGDSHPPPGRDFALALGDAFVDRGWHVSQMDRETDDPKSLWWEHSYWFLFLTHSDRSYFVQIEPIDNGNLWRVAFSLRRGCLAALFTDHQKSLVMSAALQSKVQRIIERLAKCNDLRWVTEDEAIAMW
jgi:hypothetical protein